LYGLNSFALVGRLFKFEAGLQFRLPGVVGIESESILRFSFRIELDKVAGNILDLFFSLGLFSRPAAGSQLVDTRPGAFFARIFLNFVQAGDIDIEHGIFFIAQDDRLLLNAAYFDGLESGKGSDAVVDMNYIISDIEIAQFFE